MEQPQTKEAAEQGTDSGRAPYQAVAKRGEQAQQSNAELSQQIFKAAINQHQRQVKAGQQIAQESVGAYMDFVNSMFFATQGAAQEGAEQGAEQTQR